MQVLIYRGLPGSGKTFRARSEAGNRIIVSADDYHMVDGVYSFNPANIGKAQNDCLNRFQTALRDNVDEPSPPTLIVDNTNISAWEYAPYYRLAEVLGAEPKIVTFWCSIEKSFRRNTHGVPLAAILDMARRLQADVVPSHWKHEVLMREF